MSIGPRTPSTLLTDPLSGAAHLEETVWIDAPAAAVFAWIDDQRNTGWHMSRPSRRIDHTDGSSDSGSTSLLG
jgi:hypothetical protein